MAAPLLHLKDITVAFGGKKLLDGAELSVGAGDRLCLVGRNGSGKSTLLKIAAGLDGGRQRHPLCPARRHHPLSAAGTGSERLCHHARLCRGGAEARRRSQPGLLPARAISVCRGMENPAHLCRAAKRGARPWRGRWRPGPTSCCWTSRPTIWI